MAHTTHRATMVWDADRDDLRAHTVHLAEQRIAASSAAEFGGDAEKADPEELFVASVYACHMLWFLDFSRRLGGCVSAPTRTMRRD